MEIVRREHLKKPHCSQYLWYILNGFYCRFSVNGRHKRKTTQKFIKTVQTGHRDLNPSKNRETQNWRHRDDNVYHQPFSLYAIVLPLHNPRESKKQNSAWLYVWPNTFQGNCGKAAKGSGEDVKGLPTLTKRLVN